jgi:hypothetical protein
MVYKAMRFSLTFFQDLLLVFFGEFDVKTQSPMSMHELLTVDLEFCAAEPVRSLCDFGEPQNPILEGLSQKILP